LNPTFFYTILIFYGNDIFFFENFASKYYDCSKAKQSKAKPSQAKLSLTKASRSHPTTKSHSPSDSPSPQTSLEQAEVGYHHMGHCQLKTGKRFMDLLQS
jgi:hypothetical protein